jgi:hypothetical protein
MQRIQSDQGISVWLNLRLPMYLLHFPQQYVTDLIETSDQIDTRHSYNHQKEDAIRSIHEAVSTLRVGFFYLLYANSHKAKVRFRVLRRYTGSWPVDDLIKCYLKNSSSKWRRTQGKKLAGKTPFGKKEKRRRSKSPRKSSEVRVRIWCHPLVTHIALQSV